jgi:hypothetical protein
VPHFVPHVESALRGPISSARNGRPSRPRTVREGPRNVPESARST